MQDEFSFKDKYPHKAGHRNIDTSIEVAKKVNKTLKRISKIVLLELEKVYPKGLTGTEIANKCNRSILSIRPRTTELKALGLIIDTEDRRKNEWNNNEIVYKLRGLEVLEDYEIHEELY
jgi:hypothetical protein|tara:strand:+ start:56 stop:412 length:357 start_codon:yes stop_codon:yes gene_type:complete